MLEMTEIQHHMHKLEIGDDVIYYSYETPIAFESGGELFIAENKWGVTTGKHLNVIDKDKSKRIPHKELMEVIDGSRVDR